MNSSKIIKFACLSIIGAISMVQAEQSTSDPKPATYHESIPTPTFQNIRYGEYERNVLDFWKAESEQPTPLVIVIHGGGWCVGSKEKLHEIIDPKPLLKNGISVAAINYRLIGWKMKDLKVTPRVKAPMHDAALAVQFLRSKAEEWNINKELVAATGASAGACTSLWLAYHDDLADPLNDNPVKHESTRLFCVAAKGAQTTLDPVQAREWIPNNKYGSIAFGAKGFDQFLMDRDTYLAWIHEYSPYHLLDANDPPTYLYYHDIPELGREAKDPTHTGNYGLGLKQRCDELGIECEIVHKGSPNPKYRRTSDFLITKLLSHNN